MDVCLSASVLGERKCSHPLCLDLFFPVIPISVAMTADAEHVGERRPHPPPLMKLEHQMEFSDGQTDHKKCIVTDISISGKGEIHMRLPQFKKINIDMQTIK